VITLFWTTLYSRKSCGMTSKHCTFFHFMGGRVHRWCTFLAPNSPNTTTAGIEACPQQNDLCRTAKHPKPCSEQKMQCLEVIPHDFLEYKVVQNKVITFYSPVQNWLSLFTHRSKIGYQFVLAGPKLVITFFLPVQNEVITFCSPQIYFFGVVGEDFSNANLLL